ncbi:MAG: urea ABC transporter permease subunit UrtC [Planctomycetes bacterium]|nr:urea ABC transporter permease subunit UrtC [Planctomycetota bacterium]
MPRPRDLVLAEVLRQRSWAAGLRWFDYHAPALGALLLVFGVPGLFALGLLDQSDLARLGRYCCLAMVAIGLDLVWGYAGVLSLCQMMFFTLGGYACGMYLAMHGPLDGDGIPRALFVVSSDPEGMQLPWFWKPFADPWFAAAAVVLIPGLLALVFGWLAFRSRIRGVYFAIITQAATVALWLLFCRNDLQLCGTNGLTNFTRLLGFDLTATATKVGLYIVSAATLVLTAWAVLRLTATRFGRLLLAVRDNEARLRFLGYDPVAYKTAAFVIAAVIAGIAGALYTPQTGIITPANMTAIESILVVVWVAVGGRGTVTGAVVGALAINLLYAWLTTEVPRLWPFILGALFILVVLFAPGGLVGAWRAFVRRGERTA